MFETDRQTNTLKQTHRDTETERRRDREKERRRQSEAKQHCERVGLWFVGGEVRGFVTASARVCGSVQVAQKSTCVTPRAGVSCEERALRGPQRSSTHTVQR